MKDKVISIAREILGPDIQESSSVADCPRWDSLKTLQIIMALDESGITVPLEKIANIKSIRDIIESVKQEI